MAGFILRKNQRLKKLVPVRYQRLDGIAGEGIIKDLSLSGSYMTGNVTVSVGMALGVRHVRFRMTTHIQEHASLERCHADWLQTSPELAVQLQH